MKVFRTFLLQQVRKHSKTDSLELRSLDLTPGQLLYYNFQKFTILVSTRTG